MEHIPLEQPIVDLEEKIALLHRMAVSQSLNLSQDIRKLERQVQKLRKQIFSNLTAYETTQLSRHPRRPNSLDIVEGMCTSFTEFHGDRNFYDDPAIIGGLAELDTRAVIIIGHQKGRGTGDNIARNFGMPKPEGYRKAMRLMFMAEKFGLPLITLIDTPGAYPGVGAEERGQSEAIGRSIMVMSRLQIPTVAVVIGEGGSGGALAIGVANRVHMLEHAIYSVISPEGCASILLKNSDQAAQSAEALRLTAYHARQLNLIDTVITEPLGGGHREPEKMIDKIKRVITNDLRGLSRLSSQEVLAQRGKKLASIKFFVKVDDY